MTDQEQNVESSDALIPDNLREAAEILGIDVSKTPTAAELAEAKKRLAGMNEQELAAILKYVDDVAKAVQLPEAAGIAFGELYSRTGMKINVTSRGLSTRAAAEDLIDACIHLIGEYGFQVDHPGRAPAKQAPASTPAQSVSTSAAPPPPPMGDTGNPTPAQTGDLNHYRCVKLIVKPRTDGKVELEFYGNEFRQPVDQYPITKYINTVDRCVELLQTVGAWGPEHFEGAAEYDVNFIVTWTYSERTNSKGNPYKDVQYVQPA